MRSKKYSHAIICTLLAATSFVLYTSCGDSDEFNFYEPIAQPIALNSDDRAARQEEARTLIDQKKYSEAVDILEDMVGESGLDSNDTRLLYAAALVGVAKLDVWSIITTILDDQDTSANSSGMDGFFGAFTDSLLGTGEERTAKIAAMNKALTTLKTAPSPDEDQVKNTACLFAGMLAIPTLTDAQSSLDSAITALDSISGSVGGGGSDCPDLSAFNTATEQLQTASTSFSLVLSSVENCSFLDLSEATASMNEVESQISTITSAADKGCQSLPVCPAGAPDCQDLFPTCIQEAMAIGDSNEAIADDGKIAACEIILHCTDSTECFGGS